MNQSFQNCQLRFVLDYERTCMPYFNALSNLDRCRVIELAGRRLRGGKTTAFRNLMGSVWWNPRVRIDPTSFHPLNDKVHDAVGEALKKYNTGNFGLRFDTDIGIYNLGALPAVRPRKAAKKGKTSTAKKSSRSRSGDDGDSNHTCVTVTYDERGRAIVQYNYEVEPADDDDGGRTRIARVPRFAPRKGAKIAKATRLPRVVRAGRRPFNVFDELFNDEDDAVMREIDPDRKLTAKFQIHFRFVMNLPLQHVLDRHMEHDAEA